MKIVRPVRAIIGEIFGRLPELETERLVLRRVSRDDAAHMLRYTGDAEVVRYLPLRQSRTLADALSFAQSFIDLYEAGEVAPWSIYHKADARQIGICGFENWVPRSDRAEMGFMIDRTYWGGGLAREAAEAAIAFGFAHMQLNRIEAKTIEENLGSQRLLDRLGMQREGCLREHMCWKDTYHDMWMYSLLRREYDPKRAAVVTRGL